jgi:HSP20 family protein
MALPVRRSTSLSAPSARWEPFREFDALQTQMEQLLQGVWSDTGPAGNGIWTPPVDIEETDDGWVVEAELPGAKHDDVHVEMRDNELVVRGDIKERERKGILRRTTRRAGRFEYRVTLPGETDADRIEANLKDGVLTVRVPKLERGRPREIQINKG